jgi:hypothetical protein
VSGDERPIALILPHNHTVTKQREEAWDVCLKVQPSVSDELQEQQQQQQQPFYIFFTGKIFPDTIQPLASLTRRLLAKRDSRQQGRGG